MTPTHGRAPSARELAEKLLDARTRTLLLVSPVPEDELMAQHNKLMSPIVWDLGHIAHFEELWLIRNLDGPVEFGEMPGMYNPFEHPRSRARRSSPCRRLADVLDDDGRHRGCACSTTLETAVDLDGATIRCCAWLRVRHGGAARVPAQRDHPADAAAQARRAVPRPARRRRAAGRRVDADADGMVRFPGGRVAIGTDDRARRVRQRAPAPRGASLAPFRIDVGAGDQRRVPRASWRTAATSARELWSDAGWAWHRKPARRARRSTGCVTATWLDDAVDGPRRCRWTATRPVCHVCCHEAEAYARWAGKRLPTELEWEAAASLGPGDGRAAAVSRGATTPPTPLRREPRPARRSSAAPVGAYPRNVSPIGCYGMIGDVWEWTSSDFRPYPGYETFPYAEYSEVFFGTDYKVLRGGSWATRPGAIRNTFRNWDYPIRRQIFSGFRCARDD